MPRRVNNRTKTTNLRKAAFEAGPWLASGNLDEGRVPVVP